MLFLPLGFEQPHYLLSAMLHAPPASIFNRLMPVRIVLSKTVNNVPLPSAKNAKTTIFCQPFLTLVFLALIISQIVSAVLPTQFVRSALWGISYLLIMPLAYPVAAL